MPFCSLLQSAQPSDRKACEVWPILARKASQASPPNAEKRNPAAMSTATVAAEMTDAPLAACDERNRKQQTEMRLVGQQPEQDAGQLG